MIAELVEKKIDTLTVTSVIRVLRWYYKFRELWKHYLDDVGWKDLFWAK